MSAKAQAHIFVSCNNCTAAECKWPHATLTREDESKVTIRTGKQQIICTACLSTFVDVTSGQCFQCGQNRKLTKITVCRECRNKAVALPGVRLASDDFDCPLSLSDSCEESKLSIQIDSCTDPDHSCCLECFIVTNAHRICNNELYWSCSARRFTVRCFGTNGRTACPARVESPALLQLVGEKDFAKYSSFATERLTNKLLGTVCPFPECSEAIIDLPPATVQKMVQCPYCKRSFCQKCKTEEDPMHKGVCPSCDLRKMGKDDATLRLLKNTSKACPWCGLLTTHYRGHDCHHIAPGGGCRSCHNHWCYLCGRKSREKQTWSPGCECAKTHQYCKLDGRCKCPICPDCRPNKPCHFCSGAKSCPSCNVNHPEHKDAKMLWAMQSFDYKPVNSKEELAKFVTDYKPKIKELPLTCKFFMPDFIPAPGRFDSLASMCQPPRPVAKAASSSTAVLDDALVCRSGTPSVLCPDLLCNNIYPAQEVVCPSCGQCPPPTCPWDMDRMGSKVVLATGSNVRVRKRTASWEDSTAVLKGSVVIPSGKKEGVRRRWSFRIVQGTKIIVGLVTNEFNPKVNMSITTSQHGWGYHFGTGKIGHSAGSQTKYHPANKNDRTVDVEVDGGSLRFYIDGVDKGVAYKKLPTDVPLSAAVSMYSKGDKVEVVTTGGGLWQSSKNRLGKGVSIRGNRVSKRSKGWDDGTAIMRDPVRISDTSQRRWYFIVEHGEQNTIGVVTDDYHPHTHSYVNKTKRGWGYYAGDGKKGHDGSANEDYGDKYCVGDQVMVEIRGTALHFWVNDVDQGKAFDLPSGSRIWPALSLYDKDDAVRIDTSAMRIHEEEDRPALSLSGAEPSIVNGKYTRSSSFKGCNCYTKRTGSDTIYVRRTGTGCKWVVSMNDIDKFSDGFLYECMGDPISVTPPTGSWSLPPKIEDRSTKIKAAGNPVLKFVSVSRSAAKKSKPRKEPAMALALQLTREIMAPQIAFESNLDPPGAVEEAERRVKNMNTNDAQMAFCNSYMLASNNLLEATTPEMTVLMRRFSSRMNTLFNRFDTDRDGKLHKREFCTFLETLGVWGAVPGVTPRRPASRELDVGEFVRVLSDMNSCLSNTRQTPDWSAADDLEHLGQVGFITSSVGTAYPDPGAGYEVTFPDHKMSSFVHDNLVPVMPVKVSTCSDMLLPYDDKSSTWYCDDKCSECDRATRVHLSGTYLGTRWSNRYCGGKYDLCEKCLHHHRMLPSTLLLERSYWRKQLSELQSTPERGITFEAFSNLYTQAPTRALLLERDLEYSSLPTKQTTTSTVAEDDDAPLTFYLSPGQPPSSRMMGRFENISSHPHGDWIVATGRKNFATVFDLDFSRRAGVRQLETPAAASPEFISRITDYLSKVCRPSGCPVGSVEYMDLWQHSVSDYFGQMFVGKEWDEWFDVEMKKSLANSQDGPETFMGPRRQTLSLDRCSKLQARKARSSAYVFQCDANPEFHMVATCDEKAALSVWTQKATGWVEEFAQDRGVDNRVTHFRWSPNGENLCVAYRDGHIASIHKNGTNLWENKVIEDADRCVPCKVEWSPDSQSIFVATQPNRRNRQLAHVRMLSAETSDELSRMLVTAKPPGFSKIQTIVAMECHRQTQLDKEVLLIAFNHGKFQIGPWEGDAKVVDTGLTALQACKWTWDGTLLAVSGWKSTFMDSKITSGDDAAIGTTSQIRRFTPVVQLRSRAGEFLAQLSMGELSSRPTTSLCWSRGRPSDEVPECKNKHPMELVPPAHARYTTWLCDKCRLGPPRLPVERYHCSLCSWDICTVCFKAPKPKLHTSGHNLFLSLNEVVHVTSVRPGSITRKRAAEAAATAAAAAAGASAAASAVSSAPPSKTTDDNFFAVVDWKDAKPIELAIKTESDSSSTDNTVLLRARFDNGITKIKRVSFVMTQEQADVLSVFKRAPLLRGARDGSSTVYPIQDFATALHMHWDPKHVDKPMQPADWDRLEKLLVTYLKPFPRCAGPLLVKRPLGGPPILPTDSLCVNPNFRALVRVIQYNKHTAVSSDMLELDWQKLNLSKSGGIDFREFAPVAVKLLPKVVERQLSSCSDESEYFWPTTVPERVQEKLEKMHSRERDAALKEMFEGADTNGDGELDLKEFRAIFQRNGVDIADRIAINDFLSKVDLLFQRFDRDGDKTLSKSEYRDYLEATGLWGRGPYVESAWEDEALWQRELGGLGSDSKRGIDLTAFRFLYAEHRVNKLADDWAAVMGEANEPHPAVESAASSTGGIERMDSYQIPSTPR